MEVFFVSALLVALAELGDKTQILTVLLSTRFKQPKPVLAGIFCAAIANHIFASLVGVYIADIFTGAWFRYGVAASFMLMALWSLKPDEDLDDIERPVSHGGAFYTTLITYFLVEIGDKTQIATIALAARYHSVILVTLGTAVGLLAADAPAVFDGYEAGILLPLGG